MEDAESTEDALTLMASCYLQADKVKYSSLAIEVLDYADDKKSINLDLRLQAMLAAGKEIRVVVQYLAKFFSAKWNQTADANILKKIADEVGKRRVLGSIHKNNKFVFVLKY